MTLGQGQWHWVMPNFFNAPGSSLQKTPSRDLERFSRYLRFLEGVFCKLLPGALEMLGVTQGNQDKSMN